MEQLMQQLWKEVLNLDELPGVNESFFDLGGNSYLAAMIAYAIEEKTGVKVEISDFYEHETITEILNLLRQKGVNENV